MTYRTFSLAAIAAAGLMFVAAPAFAETLNMTAKLDAASETPATDSTGTGTLEATFDTDSMEFAWNVTYEGLSGDATAAHFHGPAAVGEKAAPVVPISPPLASPIVGKATLTADQAVQLKDGKWYFNVHTAKYPDGEIRGQVIAKPAM